VIVCVNHPERDEGLATVIALSVPGLLSGFGGGFGVFLNLIYISGTCLVASQIRFFMTMTPWPHR
jgi:hypothetical protein